MSFSRCRPSRGKTEAATRGSRGRGLGSLVPGGPRGRVAKVEVAELRRALEVPGGGWGGAGSSRAGPGRTTRPGRIAFLPAPRTVSCGGGGSFRVVRGARPGAGDGLDSARGDGKPQITMKRAETS